MHTTVAYNTILYTLFAIANSLLKFGSYHELVYCQLILVSDVFNGFTFLKMIDY